MPLWSRAFAVACLLWALALPAATLVASRPQAGGAAYAAFAAYGLGAVICHQRPERSFHLWGAQMPVCARCTGIYLGAAIAALLMSFRAVRTAQAVRHISSPVQISLALAALPALATLVYEWTTGVTPSNAVRAMSGVPLGAVVAVLVMAHQGSPGRWDRSHAATGRLAIRKVE